MVGARRSPEEHWIGNVGRRLARFLEAQALPFPFAKYSYLHQLRLLWLSRKERSVRFRSAFLTYTNGFTLVALAASLLAMSGCGAKSFFDQSELSRNQGGRLVVPILTSIDPIDEAETEFVGSQEVKPDDLKVVATDYVIGRNDLIT